MFQKDVPIKKLLDPEGSKTIVFGPYAIGELQPFQPFLRAFLLKVKLPFSFVKPAAFTVLSYQRLALTVKLKDALHHSAFHFSFKLLSLVYREARKQDEQILNLFLILMEKPEPIKDRPELFFK